MNQDFNYQATNERFDRRVSRLVALGGKFTEVYTSQDQENHIALAVLMPLGTFMSHKQATVLHASLMYAPLSSFNSDLQKILKE